MKLDPHLPQLPSICELLEHPRVKGVVARINRSTIAQRATGFLDELRSSLAERTGKVEVPSIAQLAERLARRLLGEPPAGGPIINATGVVVGDPELTPPLADAALHAMLQVAGEYHDRGLQLKGSAEASLCKLTGAEAALAVGSFDAALHIVVGALAANREMCVLGALGERSGSVDWAKLAARQGAILHAAGGDLESLAPALQRKDLAAVLRTPKSDSHVPTHVIATAAKRQNIPFIDACPMAGLLDPAAYGMQSVETLTRRIEGGADLLIADGAGLLGGPPCGVILGRHSLVQAAATHFLASIATLDAATFAALDATLAIYRDSEVGDPAFSIPIWQLLSAPQANLKQRAERLSALIAATGKVASAEPREMQRSWLTDGGISLVSPTWVIAVAPKGGTAPVESHMRHWERPIAVQADSNVVHLDLRSVYPRWDQQLIEAFEGLTS